MTRLLAILACLWIPAAGAPPDLLRLTDGELEGEFAGMDAGGTVTWKREDGVAPLKFKADNLRQIVLRGGTSLRPETETAHVELVNGDRVPGRVLAMDAESLTLATDVAGTVVVPRPMIERLAPNPFGGRLTYAGPFRPDEWETVGPESLDQEENGEEDAEPDWRHVGSKWYATTGRDVLRRDVDMPPLSVLRFTAEWRSRPPLAVAFHADFAEPPEAAGEEEEENARRHSSNSAHTRKFGNAFVLSLHSSYAQLRHCGFDEDGEPFSNQVRSSSNRVNFDDTGRAEFEIRSDASQGLVTLYINGEFCVQWDAGDAPGGGRFPLPTGEGIAFEISGNAQPLRISDILVAEWNGLTDSARSLETEARDVVLLTNGTDRFSGDVRGVTDGELLLAGRYADLTIPLAEIAEVRFSRGDRGEIEESGDRRVRVHYRPLGRISGIPRQATAETLELTSPVLGALQLDLGAAAILEFQDGGSFLNIWDEDL